MYHGDLYKPMLWRRFSYLLPRVRPTVLSRFFLNNPTVGPYLGQGWADCQVHHGDLWLTECCIQSRIDRILTVVPTNLPQFVRLVAHSWARIGPTVGFSPSDDVSCQRRWDHGSLKTP